MESELNEFQLPPMPPMPRISLPPNGGRSRLHRREQASLPSRMPFLKRAPSLAPVCPEASSVPNASSSPELHRPDNTSHSSSSEWLIAVNSFSGQNENYTRQNISESACVRASPSADPTGYDPDVPFFSAQSAGMRFPPSFLDEFKNRPGIDSSLKVGAASNGEGEARNDGSKFTEDGALAKQALFCISQRGPEECDTRKVASTSSDPQNLGAFSLTCDPWIIKDSAAESTLAGLARAHSSGRNLDVFTKPDGLTPRTSRRKASLDVEQPQLREVDPPPPAESDLEEGQLPDEWSGDDDIGSGISSVQAPFEVEDQQAHFANITGMSKSCRKKHSKGEGSKKRSREKAKDKCKAILKSRKAEQCEISRKLSQGGDREGTKLGGRSRKAEDFDLKIAPDIKLATASDITGGGNAAASGKNLPEPKTSTMGSLSMLVDDEVGLWTKDEIDDEMVAELNASEILKKGRGPDTAERKLKRKIAKRKKRAEKERKLGIRRTPRIVSSKPVKVICTHYMKGRCSKGDKCSFSHNALPLTKQEPCKFLMSNSCLKGDDCPYSHDLQAFPCKYFHTRGLCYDGGSCQFSHAAISEEELQKLRQRVEKEKKDRSSGLTQSPPMPQFSTPLPPELDPDPLGWDSCSSITFTQLSHSENTQEDSVINSRQRSEQSSHATLSETASASASQRTDSWSSTTGKNELKVAASLSRRGETGKKLGNLTVYDTYRHVPDGSMTAQSLRERRFVEANLTSFSPAISELSRSGKARADVRNSPVPLNDCKSEKASLDISSLEKEQTEPCSSQDKSVREGFSSGRANECTRAARGSSEVPNLSLSPTLTQMAIEGRECEMETDAQLPLGQRTGSFDKPPSSPKASAESQKAVENIIQQVLDFPTASIFDVTKIFGFSP